MAPVLPDSAPFTPEQRGWLNGYIAAMIGSDPLLSRPRVAASTAARPPAPKRPSQSCRSVTILWGSQTGNAEALARKAAKGLAGAGPQVAVHDMAAFPVAQLAGLELLVVITSTSGDGEPPDNAAGFHAFLHSDQAPKLDRTRFAVFALGDSEYPDFCACGRQIDAQLEALGGTRLVPRIDADVDFDEPFAEWQASLLAALPACAAASAAA